MTYKAAELGEILAAREAETKAQRHLDADRSEQRASQTELDRLTKELATPANETCPTCHQMLQGEARAKIVEARHALEMRRFEVLADVEAATAGVAKAEAYLATIISDRIALESKAVVGRMPNPVPVLVDSEVAS